MPGPRPGAARAARRGRLRAGPARAGQRPSRVRTVRPPSPAPAGPASGDQPDVPPAVEAALAALDGVVDRPLEEHVDVFDEVHRRLQDALATLDER